MAHKQEVKDAVRSDYINHRLSCKEAADRHGVGYKTVLAWKKKADEQGQSWDVSRAAANVIQTGMSGVAATFLEEFVRLYRFTVDELNRQIKEKPDDFDPHKTAESLGKMADAFTKTTKAVYNTAPSFGRLATAQEVLEELTGYLRQEHPEKLADWVKLLQGFSRRVAEVFAD